MLLPAKNGAPKKTKFFWGKNTGPIKKFFISGQKTAAKKPVARRVYHPVTKKVSRNRYKKFIVLISPKSPLGGTYYWATFPYNKY